MTIRKIDGATFTVPPSQAPATPSTGKPFELNRVEQRASAEPAPRTGHPDRAAYVEAKIEKALDTVTSIGAGERETLEGILRERLQNDDELGWLALRGGNGVVPLSVGRS